KHGVEERGLSSRFQPLKVRMHCSPRTRLLQAGVLFAVLSTPALAEKEGVIVRRPGEIEFTATVNSKAFDSGPAMPGYHAIVWRGGKAAHAALLEAEVTDRQVLEAIEAMGGKPGDNLPMESWEERKNPKNPAPDLVIAGPAVDVFLRLPGRREPVALQSV